MEYIQGLINYKMEVLNLVLLIIILSVIIAVVLYIIHLRNKLENFENPKYGFLGKNIYPLIGFIMLGSVIIFASYGMMYQRTEDTEANIQLEGKISAEVQRQTLSLVTVNFNFIPIVSGKQWGTASDKYDIYWEINGPHNFTKQEIQKSSSDPGGFIITLPKGPYHIEITVVYQDQTYKFEDRLDY